jgi:hypothetical protein
MLNRTEHLLARFREIANELSLATPEIIQDNPEWFEELSDLYNEMFPKKMGHSDPWYLYQVDK